MVDISKAIDIWGEAYVYHIPDGEPVLLDSSRVVRHYRGDQSVGASTARGELQALRSTMERMKQESPTGTHTAADDCTQIFNMIEHGLAMLEKYLG